MSRGPTKKRTGLISRLFWLTNLVMAIALLGAYLSAYVNPEITSLFAFLGLAYIFLLALNILFVLYWLIRGNKKLLLSLIVILIGYNPLISHVQLMPGREAPAGPETLKILSYNVHNMAHGNIGQDEAGTRGKIYGFLAGQKADIACIQEFSARGSNVEDIFNDMKSLTQFPECFYIDYVPEKSYRTYSIVILSKEPSLNSGSLSIPGDNHNFGIYIDILHQQDTIRVYNLHLESIRLQQEDYQFVEDMSRGQTESGTFGEGSKSILRKLHNAYKLRAQQAIVVEESLNNCPYPVLICGDFNDTPLSFAYHKISAGLNDAFVNAGYGLGSTFAGNLPYLRIDFIFHSDDFNSCEFEVHKTRLSDHYPVSVYLTRK